MTIILFLYDIPVHAIHDYTFLKIKNIFIKDDEDGEYQTSECTPELFRVYI